MSTRGYIYVIRSGTSDVYKIGYSADPVARCKALQIGSAAILRLVGVRAGSRALEKSIHHGLRDKRVHHEWFRLTRVEVDAILYSGSDLDAML